MASQTPGKALSSSPRWCETWRPSMGRWLGCMPRSATTTCLPCPSALQSTPRFDLAAKAVSRGALETPFKHRGTWVSRYSRASTDDRCRHHCELLLRRSPGVTSRSPAHHLSRGRHRTRETPDTDCGRRRNRSRGAEGTVRGEQEELNEWSEGGDPRRYASRQYGDPGSIQMSSLVKNLKQISRNMRGRRIKYLCIAVILLLYTVYVFFGVGDLVRSRSFEESFDYPLNVDIQPLIKQVLAGTKPRVKPINYYPYRYLTNSGICSTADKLDLFIVVKSAMGHFDSRMAIRQTYGHDSSGQESVTPGRVTKILFFLGVEGHKTETQTKIRAEMAEFKDIIQMDFLDTYYNNTIKTMMSFRWQFEHCSAADFYLFTDDDMYISVPNLLEYIESATVGNGSTVTAKDDFYSGYTFKSGPHRIVASKWRVTLDEYPWDKWPHYVTAGAYVVSNRSMKELYVASLFVKHFRFDDIYLGIVARKAGIVPTHCDRFYFYKKPYTKEGYRDVIASHGYDDRETLVRVWNEQHSL